MFGDIKFAITCEHCDTTGEAKIWSMVNYTGTVTTTLTKEKFDLPGGWLSLEWWSKAKGSESKENVIDQATFCSLGCTIKYFQKKRRDLNKEQIK